MHFILYYIVCHAKYWDKLMTRFLGLFLSVTHSLVLWTHCRLTFVLLTGWIVIRVVFHLWTCETSAERAHPISTAAEEGTTHD